MTLPPVGMGISARRRETMTRAVSAIGHPGEQNRREEHSGCKEHLGYRGTHRAAAPSARRRRTDRKAVSFPRKCGPRTARSYVRTPQARARLATRARRARHPFDHARRADRDSCHGGHGRAAPPDVVDRFEALTNPTNAQDRQDEIWHVARQNLPAESDPSNAQWYERFAH